MKAKAAILLNMLSCKKTTTNKTNTVWNAKIKNLLSKKTFENTLCMILTSKYLFDFLSKHSKSHLRYDITINEFMQAKNFLFWKFLVSAFYAYFIKDMHDIFNFEILFFICFFVKNNFAIMHHDESVAILYCIP